ncbi:acetyl-CoA decarbonylase/synthase complex subunit alpha/beta [Parasporobacterium paucivorans]|uniref:CO-methylating acetyl-CoA synthase n=1 Tax=Parasporobacterium paucivorans DSM 15970 TaxID=1122934 RepID=A0A1M6A869_9FIRM|nr:acetyl-CoA decarbonylase/synthase complex subunit alpha/beta [Parasporobacterium paucivorans]SHI32658.1 acetyl-CoA decarbonylase/synthase beta subunit [Parasporobacterium paucivorans DSM 15970]
MNLFKIIYSGMDKYKDEAEKAVQKAIMQKGRDAGVKLPQTAYALPVIYAITGKKIITVGGLEEALALAGGFVHQGKTLQQALDAGTASAMYCEIIEAVKYTLEENPYPEPLQGHLTDAQIRAFGVALVTQDIPGVPVIIGECKDSHTAASIVKDYQEKGMLTFLVGKVIDQCIAEGVKMGIDLRVIPLGYEIESVIHVVSVAIRASLIFGNVQPGDYQAHKQYTKDRVKAFVNVFSDWDDKIIAAGAAAIELGFPAVTETYINEVPTLLLHQPDNEKTVDTSLEARKIKIKVTKIDAPVGISSAFEGERIRKADMYAEFGGNKTKAFELVRMVDLSEVEDHKIEIIGPDIDTADSIPYRLPLALVIDVAGKLMQEDFEPVLERRLHYFLNYIEGVMHVGQRNISWIRIGKEAYEKGFRLKHLGEVIYAKMRDEFDTVVDKCQVTIYTDAQKVAELEEKIAFPKYVSRDRRLASLTDESVDTFYSCKLCQSFAPAHVCIVTPERLGLCGAVSWLDAKATKELDPHGSAQPVPKEGCLDEKKGIWTEVSKTVAEISQGAVTNVSLYSILEDPMTSCGCFECICGIMPEANGVVIVNREFGEITPTGMTFGELASMTGGGVQTPGFMGHGRHFIGSKKFLYSEGGIARIVWMPKELKNDVAERLNKTAKELYDIDNFTDMICDETIATDSEGVLEYLSEKGHPALEMESII